MLISEKKITAVSKRMPLSATFPVKGLSGLWRQVPLHCFDDNMEANDRVTEARFHQGYLKPSPEDKDGEIVLFGQSSKLATMDRCAI